MSVEFLLTALIVVLLPGTGVLYTLATGLGAGARAATAAAFGCTLGILPQLLLATFGLSAILQANGAAFQLIKFAGALYLLFMALQVLGGEGALAVRADRPSHGYRRLIGTGVWLNLLNPKLGLFFVAFLPQFVPSNADAAKTTFLALGFVFVVMTLVVFVAYGVFAAWIRRFVISNGRVMNVIRWSFATAFLLLAVKLGFDPS